jgi:hypothetical protein
MAGRERISSKSHMTSVGRTIATTVISGANLTVYSFSSHRTRTWCKDDDFEDYLTSGTSCSAPLRLSLLPLSSALRPFMNSSSQTVAPDVILLLEDFRLANDKDPLGFHNPWLCGRGLACLSSIRSSSNPGCNTDGFSTIEGWDPVRLARLVANFKLHKSRVWGFSISKSAAHAGIHRTTSTHTAAESGGESGQ